MPLSHYCTEHSGFWQERPSLPDSCPVCEDYRHPLPPNGYAFLTPEEVDDRVSVKWMEVLPGITMFWTEPQIGIGSRGFVVERPDGNIAFEGATWYSDAALDHIESLGGVQYLSASHAHVYGALWRLSERFSPETVIQEAELPYAQAFSVTWPFEGCANLSSGAVLHHTGGHTPGHAVLHLEDRRLLFCGDALKFTLDEYPVGNAVTISTHRAYDAHIPLTHADIRQYRDLMEPLDFDAVITPWEVVPSGGKDAALRLFTSSSAAARSPTRFPWTRTRRRLMLLRTAPGARPRQIRHVPTKRPCRLARRLPSPSRTLTGRRFRCGPSRTSQRTAPA